MPVGGLSIVGADQDRANDALGDYLEQQLNRLRDLVPATAPADSLRDFQGFLDTLPPSASSVFRMRVKANIGLRHLALDDSKQAEHWLNEAYREAPEDPRAIAHKALAMWLGGDGSAAYNFGLKSLAADPTNDGLAAFLPQIAVALPEIVDAASDTPAGLQDHERVVGAQIMFLRGRNIVPEWWEKARSAAARFPASDELAILTAFAELDELTRGENVQRSQSIPAGKERPLRTAAEILDRHASALGVSVKSRFSDGAHALGGAMVCYRLLQERDKALLLAHRVATEGLTDPVILANAIQVALAYGAGDLAEQLFNLAPDDPEILFHGGVLALQSGNWALAADRLARAAPPETEHEIVDTVLSLAKIKLGKADAPSFEQILDSAMGHARSLVIVARVAADLGRSEDAERAYQAAIENVGPDPHIAARLMVASLAEDMGTPSDIIDLLDGKLPSGGYDNERGMLARAHANERPHRQRNLEFFRGLPEKVRDERLMALCHSSVLIDTGNAAAALPILRRLRRVEGGNDAVTLLRLFGAHRQTGDERGARRLLQSIDLEQLTGPPNYRMGFIQTSVPEKGPLKAYSAAYKLVKENPTIPEVALGYLGLGLELIQDNPAWAPPSTVELGTCVRITANGQERTFIIEDGPPIYGRDVEPLSSAASQLVLGKRSGDAISIPRTMLLDTEEWLIAEIRSKYLDLHARIIDEFEIRYPGVPGISRVLTQGENIKPILNAVKRVSEANRKIAAAYLEGKSPLGIVAKALGGDIISVSEYIRHIGGEIRTCLGSEEERDNAVQRASKARGKGAVLDPFTAYVAAEMKLLPLLRSWFGELKVPESTLHMIDELVARQQAAIGKKMMIVGWHNGEYIRDEITDEFRQLQIDALQRERAAIVESCAVEPVVLPNELSETTKMATDLGGDRYVDAAFLAKYNKALLISDDLQYRELAVLAAESEGAWLQAVMMAMTTDDVISFDEYVSATADLAARRHGHVALNGAVLFKIYLSDNPSLSALRSTFYYLAGKEAEMESHFVVLLQFLGLLWGRPAPDEGVKRDAAAGAALTAFIRHRGEEGKAWLKRLHEKSLPRSRLRRHLDQWLYGHFIVLQ